MRGPADSRAKQPEFYLLKGGERSKNPLTVSTQEVPFIVFKHRRNKEITIDERFEKDDRSVCFYGPGSDARTKEV